MPYIQVFDMVAKTININNYEAFLLDHFEGNLSEEGYNELLGFLSSHPELNDVFNQTWGDNKLDPKFGIEDYYYPAELLKKFKPANHELSEIYNLVEEGEEPSGELALLIQEDTILRLHYTAYQHSILAPDLEEKLDAPFKQSLRKTNSIQYKPIWLAIAAVALLLVIFKLTAPVFTSESTQQLTQVEELKPKENTLPTNNYTKNQESTLAETSSDKSISSRDFKLNQSKNSRVHRRIINSQKATASNLTEPPKEFVEEVAFQNPILPELDYIDGRQTHVEHRETFFIVPVRINISPQKIEKKKKTDGLISNGIIAFLSRKESLQKSAIKSIQYIDQNGLLGLSTSRSEKGQIESVTLRIADRKFYQSL